jgi:hypothetical protein
MDPVSPVALPWPQARSDIFFILKSDITNTKIPYSMSRITVDDECDNLS